MTVVHVMKMTGVAGAEKHLLLLTAGQRARGLDVHVIMLHEPGKPVRAFLDAAAANIPLHPLVIRADLDPTLPGRLRTLFRALRARIVHTHLLHADVHGIPAARLAGVPVVLTSRHNDNAFRRARHIRLMNRWLWRWADAGIAISDSIRRFAIEVEDAPAAKVRVIPYGIPLERRSPAEWVALRESVRAELNAAPGDLLLGIACRLVEQKGVHYAIRAFAAIAERFDTARLLIAGDGPLRPALEAEARAAGIADRVRFLGWRDDVPRLMAGLDVLLMPSLWEGFGLVILEAMNQRLPVIASRVSAIPEIVVDGETGLLVPARDIDGLAGALALLLQDNALRRHMGLLAEDRLETHFSADTMVSCTIDLYNDLLARRGKNA